jgi:hypothetical protein
MVRRNRAVKLSVMLLGAVSLSACLVPIAAGAGGAVFLSGHTAEAIVERSVTDMSSAAETVLASEGVAISASHTEDSGATRSFEGRKGDLDITVIIEREEGGTKLRVTAKRNSASWDDDYAKALLAKIIG